MAAHSGRANTSTLAAGAVGVVLLIAALLTTNGTLALIEAIVGVLLITSLVAGYALRRNSRSTVFDRISQEDEDSHNTVPNDQRTR